MQPHDQPLPPTPADTAERRPSRGSRIRLIATSDPYTRLTPGALGTVTGIDSLGTICVSWDDGSSLGLIPDLDEFDVL